MSRSGAPRAVERLVFELFDRSVGDPFAIEVVGWLAGSDRFRKFAEANRDKIRKKLRGAAEAEARLDVRAELRVAHLLLAEKRIDLTFEAYGSGKVGPDFTVSFRGERAVNLEVTRMRRTPDATGLGETLLAKLRQLPPSVPNAVLVAIAGGDAEAIDVGGMNRAIRARADAKDEAYFIRRGFESSRAFYERFLRLGAIIVWSETANGDQRAALWASGSARIPIPVRAARACVACLRAG
jgi:hypothetical protein